MAIGGIPYYLDKLRNDRTMTDNIDSIFFADELIHQEFKDVYTGLYSSKEKYVDIVKAIGSKFYGMTQSELSKATGIKTGGTLTKLLDNLRESGITREYPRYGKERVETVYQLKISFSILSEICSWQTSQTRRMERYPWDSHILHMGWRYV